MLVVSEIHNSLLKLCVRDNNSDSCNRINVLCFNTSSCWAIRLLIRTFIAGANVIEWIQKIHETLKEMDEAFMKKRVIYWPSTELSIKRCTCVNKRKNSGSRWTLNNNITRCTDNSSQLGTRCRSESQQQTERFGPSVIHGWATPAKMRKKCCYGHEKNLGQYSSLSPSPTHLSHTTNITLSRIKCERFIFL